MPPKDLSTICTALFNPERIKLIACLSEQEATVSMLLKKCTLSQSALSQHLAKLRTAGIVCTRRDGTHIYYRVSLPAYTDLANTLITLTQQL